MGLKILNASNLTISVIASTLYVMWIHPPLLPPVQHRKHKIKMKLRCKEML